MSYFSPRVIAHTPLDPSNYVCPAISKGQHKAPRFSLFPSVLRSEKTAITGADGKAILVPHKDVKTSTAHSVARIASVLFATLGTLGLAALSATLIFFPAVLLPTTALILGGVVGGYYFLAMTIALISKATLKNEMIQKPEQLKEPSHILDPIKKSCEVAYKPKVGKEAVDGIAYVPVTTKETIENESIGLYEPTIVEVAKGHRQARITAVALAVIGMIAAAVFAGLLIFNPAVIIVPIPIVAGVIAGVLATAFVIHLISKKTLKNEVIPIEKKELQVQSKNKDTHKIEPIEIYKNVADWSKYKTHYIRKIDLSEIAKYKNNYRLTDEFTTQNNTSNQNVSKIPYEDAFAYRLAYFFFWWV